MPRSWRRDKAIVQESSAARPALQGSDSVLPDAVAEARADTTMAGGWGNGGRAAAEQEVSAARTPRFASLRADAEGPGLGPRRGPGAGPMPGGGSGWATAGPRPPVRTVPPPASE